MSEEMKKTAAVSKEKIRPRPVEGLSLHIFGGRFSGPLPGRD